MKITFLGHACVLIELQEATLLVDPFISGNDLAKDIIDIDSLNPDFILITHAHQDHTLDVERIATQNGATLISNFEIINYYQRKGYENIHPMNHGGRWKFNFGWLKYVNAIHTSSFEDGSYGGQPGGFILDADGKQVYIAGDTALTLDMKLIPATHQLDLAILPIGDNFTMGVQDAIRAAEFVQCNRVMGYHFDTFEPIRIDHEMATREFERAGLQLQLLDIGDSLEV